MSTTNTARKPTQNLTTNLTRTQLAVNSLQAQGIDIINCIVGDGPPTIWITPPMRAIFGATRIVQTVAGKSVPIFVAEFQGCRVKWCENQGRAA